MLPTMRKTVLTLILGSLLIMTLPTAHAQTDRAQPAQTLWLVCPQSATGQDMALLCETLQEALQGALPGHTLRGQAGPGLPPAGAPWVQLQITAASARGLSAHLEWHLPEHKMRATEQINLSVMDGPATKDSYQNLARPLTQISDKMIQILNHT